MTRNLCLVGHGFSLWLNSSINSSQILYNVNGALSIWMINNDTHLKMSYSRWKFVHELPHLISFNWYQQSKQSAFATSDCLLIDSPHLHCIDCISNHHLYKRSISMTLNSNSILTCSILSFTIWYKEFFQSTSMVPISSKVIRNEFWVFLLIAYLSAISLITLS